MKDMPRRIIIPAMLAIFLSASACAPRATQAPAPPDKTVPARPTGLQFLAALEEFSQGRYEQSARRFDQMLALTQPADSQFTFLGLYYGLRARLALGRQDAADSLFAVFKSRVPTAQAPELLAALGRTPAQPPATATLAGTCRRIGVILPLSGRYADFGLAIQEGVKIAVDRYNAGQGEDGRVDLLFRDDQSDPLTAAALGRELAKDSSLAALIGSYQDDASLSLAMTAANLGIPLICPTADAPSLGSLGPLVHAINRTDPVELERLAAFAVHELGLQIFAVLAPDNAKGASLAADFCAAVRKSGGVVVSDQRYSGENNKFDSQMTLLQRYLPDAIYIPADPNDITQIASQVHYYGLGQSRVLGTEAWRSERVLRMGGEYVEGVMFASPFYEDSRELEWDSFKTVYERTCNRPVNKYSALGYDAARLVLEAAGQFPVSRKGLAAALDKVSGMPGAYGNYSVAADGRVERRTFILEVKGGEVIPAHAPVVTPAEDSLAAPQETPAQPSAPGTPDERQ